ncbi:MAG TPA: hypothetical protein VF511_10805 [Chthoniobacterales bacterium]
MLPISGIRLALLLLALILLPEVPCSLAGTTWTGGGGTGNASWGTAGNWGSALPPFDGTALIVIGTGFASGTTLTVDGNRDINDLTINNTTGFTIASGTGGTLTLRSGNITRTSATGSTWHTISAGLVLGASGSSYTGTWNIGGTGYGLITTGDISEAGGSRAITLTGGRILNLGGNNSFSGGVTVTSGTLQVSSNANLGATSGGITLNGGALELQGDFTSARTVNISAASSIYMDAGKTVEMTGAVSGNGNLTVSFGAGTLILSGSGSNGTGSTTIGTGAVLSLRGTVALGSGNLLLNSGGILELGNGNLTRALGTGVGQVNVGNGGSAGFAAWGADRVVNFGNSGATVTWGSTNFNLGLSSNALFFGSSTANATLDFQNNLDLGGVARIFTVTRGTGTSAEGKISGAISGASPAGITLTSSNGGRLLLTNGNNSYAGATLVKSGYLWIGANATSGAGNTALGSNTGVVQVGDSSGALDAGLMTAAPVTISRDIRVQSSNTGTISLGGVTADASTFSGAITLGSVTTAGKSLTLSAVNGGTVTFSGVIADPAGITGTKGVVTKGGYGTVKLTNANTYGGGSIVSSGSLFANNSSGSATGTGSITVSNSGTIFGGSGTVTGAVSVASGANLAPGASGNASTSSFRTGALTLSSGANFNIDINSTTAGSGYDQLSVTGAVSVNGSNLLVNAASNLTLGDKFFVLLNDGSDAVTGSFAQGSTVTAANGSIFSINYADNADGGATANDISLTFTAVPEPTTYFAAALAAAAILRASIARRASSNSPSHS